MSDSSDIGFVRLWHRRGCQVSIPLGSDIKTFHDQIEYLFDAGWLAQAPGLEEGEEKEMVAYVVHGEHERDGQATPFLLLYSDNDAMKWSFLKVYLNRAEDVAAFEYASRMRLDKIDLYIGQDKPERGKSRQVDRFIVAPPKPFGVVYKKNPKWDEHADAASRSKGEIYSIPKRVFVRWQDEAPKTDQPVQTEENPAPVQSSQPTASQKPKTGAELLAWLETLDAAWVKKYGIGAGYLVLYIDRTLRAKWGVDMRTWGAVAIDEAIEEAKQFGRDAAAELERKKAQDADFPF